MIVLTGAKGDVNHLAFSPDGRLLAASGGGRGLELWDIPSGNKWGRYDKMSFADGPTAFHPTEAVCFAPAAFGVAEIETDTKKGRVIGIHKKGINRFGAMAMLPDGSGLICHLNADYFFAGHLQLLLWERGKELQPDWKLALGKWEVRAAGTEDPQPQVLGVAPDGDVFVTLDTPHGRAYWSPSGVELVRVAVRSAKNGKLLRSAEPPRATARAFAISPGGAFATCRAYGLDVWDANDLKAEPRRVKNDSRSLVTGVAFHPSGKYLAVTSNDATVKLYDTTNWRVAKTYTWEIGKMRSVAFSPDGTLAAAGSDTGKVVVWDVDV